ncbi:MAG TPA: insulinase family protein, partial [Burkholderiaceae bacterium]
MAPLQRLASLMVVLLLPALAPLGHAAAAGAGPLPAGVTRHHSVEGITEYRLANGLRVLLFPDASRPTVTVNVTYLVGSRHENYGETGMAHLLEHLLFKDTRAHPDLVRELDRRGMDYNGTTSFDRTTYYESFQASADHLRWALRMEADRMTGARLLAADLASEMTVVRNEFEMGENSPSDVLGKRMQAMAYDWHSYGRSTIGNRSDIENVGLSNLRAFYRTWYQPDNAVLVIAGQFDERAALRTVADSFGTIKRPQRKLPAFWTAEPTQDGERSVTVRRKGDVQMIALAYKIPGALHDDTDGLAYMADILGDTPNGRLHQRLVATGMAAEAYAYAEMNYAPGLLVVGAAVKKGQPLEPVKEALIDLAENFYKVPPTAEEMARIARNTEHGFDSLLADPQRVALALSDAIALGDWRLMFQAREKLAKVTAAQVTATAARYIVRDNRVTGLFLPEDAPRRAEIEVAPGPDVAMQGFVPRAAVASVAAFDPTQDNIDRHTEISRIDGLKLALLPKPTRASLVTVNINLHWGDERNLFGKSVLPGMTSAMLSRGTTRYTRQQLADAFDRLRISGSLNSFTTTREHLAEALRLVAHVMKEPAFPQAEFEQLKQRALVGIEASRNDPQALAARELARLFNPYPKGDVRAAMPLDEQLATVQAVTLEAVKNFYRDFHGASHGEIAIVGDFDALQARAIIVQEFGNWKSRARYARL